MTICRRAACSTEEPPRMAPVIVPGMDIIPITLSNVLNKMTLRNARMRSPHGVDHRYQCQAQSFDGDWFAGLIARRAKREIRFHFVSVVSEETPVRKWESRVIFKYVHLLQFLQDVFRRYNDPRNIISAEHPHDRDCRFL